MPSLDRRRLLAALAGASGLAGCGGDDADPTTTSTRHTTADRPSTTVAAPTSTAEATTSSEPTTEPRSTSQPTRTTEPFATPPPMPSEPSPPPDMDAVRTAVQAALDIADERVTGGPFDPTWDSLGGFQVPEWFRDRKFGIYFHWGLYTVPAYQTEWYPKWMYEPDRRGWGGDIYDFHVDHLGEPDEFPYHAFAPYFTAEDFDPSAWAKLFRRAGAGFAGPVAEHHDGWSNWRSTINPYNAGSRGPERDLLGELADAIRDEGLKFVATFHHGRAARPDRVHPADGSAGYYAGAYDHFPRVTEGFPNRLMYRNVSTDFRWQLWFAKLVEVLERYQPDLVWHDSIHVPPEEIKLRYLAYNLNRAVAQDRSVAVTYKEVPYTEALRESVAIRDYENDQADDLRGRPWLTDTSIANGSWGFTYTLDFRPLRELIREFVTIVSKNGQLLLNVQPRADGNLPRPVVDRLEGFGDWLDVAGEAIYRTRPWHTWRDGANIRYTRSKDESTMYGFHFGWPGGETVRFPSVPASGVSSGSVRILGYGEVPAGRTGGAVSVTVPELGPGDRPSGAAVGFAFDDYLE